MLKYGRNVFMSKQEFLRLRNYWYAKRNAPYTMNRGRKHTKGRAAGVGQILVTSFIKQQIHPEKVFISHT